MPQNGHSISALGASAARLDSPSASKQLILGVLLAWLSTCPSVCFMNGALLSLLAFFTVNLFAAEQGASHDDPFAASREAVAGQLATILQHAPAPFRDAHDDPTRGTASTHDESTQDVAHRFAKRYWGGREASFSAALDRLEQLRPRLEPILGVEGVPPELLAIVLVESGAQPLAMSPRQARGLWQFIPETARQYGLTIAGQTDERVHAEAATRAAARYLRDLYNHFGNWPLVFAAYNAGQRTVDAAVEKGHATTFWELSSAGLLPQETRDYVPAVLAAIPLLRPTRTPTIPTAPTQSSKLVYATTRSMD